MTDRSARHRTRPEHDAGPRHATGRIADVLAVHDRLGWRWIESETCKPQQGASSNPGNSRWLDRKTLPRMHGAPPSSRLRHWKMTGPPQVRLNIAWAPKDRWRWPRSTEGRPDDGDPPQSGTSLQGTGESVGGCRDRATALIENIWREKIRGCSYSGGSAAAVNLGSPESPLSADSDQLPLRRHDGPIDWSISRLYPKRGPSLHSEGSDTSRQAGGEACTGIFSFRQMARN